MQISVKKLGGENAANITLSGNNIKNHPENEGQIVVVSAMRGEKFNTTDELINIGKELGQENISSENIKNSVRKITSFHEQNFLEQLGDQDPTYHTLLAALSSRMAAFGQLLQNYRENPLGTPPNKENDYSIQVGEQIISVIGFGETLSAELTQIYLQAKNINAEVLDATNIISAQEAQDMSKSEIYDEIANRFAQKISTILNDNKVPVIGGYIGRFPNGIENAIGRGYSDATAGMISVGLANRNHDVTLEIQKSVAGLLSIDPRLLKNKKDAQLIESIDYTTAREMIGERGAQAKLLHNQVLRDELQKAGVKVRLFDPSNTSHSGTLISNEKNTQSSGVEFVGKRSKVLYFTISSGNMETGFLQQLFAIAAKYGSVDFVSTTETEVTFTMDAANFEKTTPSQLAEDIRNTFGLTDDEHMENVKISDAKSLLFLIGQNLGISKSALAEAILLLEKNNIRVDLTNDAAENRGYILGVNTQDELKAVRLLHRHFIKTKKGILRNLLSKFLRK